MIQKLYDEASELFNSKNYEEAIPKFKQVLSIDENVAEAWEFLGHSFYLLENFNDAIIAYKRSVALEPDNIEYIKYLGEAYFFSENYEEALDEYLKIISFDSKNNNALLYAAQCYLFLGNNDEALWSLQKTSNLSKEDKSTKKEIHSVILSNMAYQLWPVYDKEGNRFPASRRQYKKAKKLVEKAQTINSKGEWARDELKWMRGVLKRSKRRIFIGSYLIIILTLIFSFFTMGGVKGFSWERHKKIITSHAAIGGQIVSTSFSSLNENGNFTKTSKLFADEKFLEKIEESVNGLYVLGFIWLVFLILYLFSARIPLYLSQKRLKNYGKFTNALAKGMDDLQRTDTRWKTTLSDGSVSYEDDYSGTIASLFLLAFSIILTLLFLPLSVILNFLRNYVFYI